MSRGSLIGTERRVRATLIPGIHRIYMGWGEWQMWEYDEHVEIWSVESLQISFGSNGQNSEWKHDHYRMPSIVTRMRWRFSDWRSNRRLTSLLASARLLAKRPS